MRNIKRGFKLALAVFSFLMMILPESMFSKWCWITHETFNNYRWASWIEIKSCNIIITRASFFTCIFIIMTFASMVYSTFERVKIKGNNYSIVVEYGNLLKKKKGQRVINFDECFTTTVGTRPCDIKEDSICGQYLQENPDINVQGLIKEGGILPCKRKSKYNKQICFEPGTLVPNGDDLLMAYTKLDSNGRSLTFSLEDYLKCLSLLWEEIDKYYCQKDIYIPILGSGVSKISNGISKTMDKEELLDLMISSYKLSTNKLNGDNSLHIICKRGRGFSINKYKKLYY